MRYTLLLLLLTLPGANLLAYDPLADEELNDYVEPVDDWKEMAVELPSPANQDNLQSFRISGRNDPFEYFIDRDSLQTGEDRVTRFLLLIRSNRGAVNSSYEGFRCGKRLHKVYAYGDGENLTAMPGAEWEELPKGGKDYKTILYEDLICNILTGSANPADAVFSAMQSDRKVDAPFIDSER
jgi:hypothetical protein